MMKNLVFFFFILIFLFVAFTNTGFDLALSIVGKGVQGFISLADTIK